MSASQSQKQAARLRAERRARFEEQLRTTDLRCRKLTPEELAALPPRGSARLPGAFSQTRYFE